MSSLLTLLLLCSLILAAPANPGEIIFFDGNDGQLFIDCPSNTNYTSGSAFQANLGALLSSIPGVAAASSGFAENVTGAAPDKAYGLAQCRGDVTAFHCQACLDSLAQYMATWCPGQKSATLVYDNCLLRHSNVSFFGAIDTSEFWYLSNSQNATQPAQFTSALDALMKNLTATAAYASPRKFAAGSAALAPFENIYGIAQCTLDVAADDCYRCFLSAVAAIPSCCNGKQGGRVIYRSCAIRFQEYPFYNVSAAEAAMSPTPSPGAGPINGRDHFVPTVVGAGSKRTVRMALLVTIPSAVSLLVVLIVALYIRKRIRKPLKHAQTMASVKGHGADEEMRSSQLLLYDLSTLRAATDNFSEENKLGEAGFGPVYKGVLRNGQEIAVKRLSNTSQQGLVEMKNEVVLVAKLQHRNLVRLLGCCIEKQEKLLVYEFLSNKSLDKILYGPARQSELSWEQKYKVIYGIGRGLMYLHEDSRMTIIHRDLKPGNILLDTDMNPKISDFGLAKLFNFDDLSVANTNHLAGTRGYMAPEYVFQGIFSTKSDVFSYGVLVLEIITGRRPSKDLLKFVWRHWSQGNVSPLLDGSPPDDHWKQEMLRCIHIGLLCVQDDPQLRPRMAAVVLMLNSHSMTLAVPTEPVFTAPGKRPWVAALEPSTNEASISYLEPR